MAPPKRKTGGRVTPAGTRPGDTKALASRSTTDRSATSAAARAGGSTRVGASSRYTPPVPRSEKESPPWLPMLMIGLFAVGALAIMARYLIFPDSNWPMLVGLACLLGGLYTATKWR